MQNPKPKLISFFIAAVCCVFFVLAGRAQAATYYVDATNGNDSWTGTAGAYQSGSTGPWKTISKINGFNFQPGDDVYLKCGGTWQEQLVIDWSGLNAANPVIIGAYYMSGNLPVLEVSGAKPKFLGQRWNGSSCFPDDQYGAMISSVHNSFVTIQDIEIRNSGSYGISLGADYESREAGHGNHHVKRCDFYDIDAGAIAFTYENYNSAYGTIGGTGLSSVTDCHIDGTSLTDHYNYQSGNAITANFSRNVTIARNRVNRSYGEGIGIYENFPPGVYNSHLGYSTIEHNVVSVSRRTGIYLASSEGCVARYNLVYNDSSNADFANIEADGRYYGGSGIEVGEEAGYDCDYGNLNNNEVYGNLITGGWLGIGLFTWDGTVPESSISGNKIYNNTVVGCLSLLHIGGTTYLSMDRGTGGNEIKNNIFWNPDPTLSQRAVYYDITQISNKLALDYNLWYKTPEFLGAQGAHDPAYAAPSLAKTTGWPTIAVGSLTFDDFKLQSNSPAIDKGVTLDFPYNTDYFSLSRPQGIAFDIGAHEYATGGTDTQAPASPSGLQVR